MFARYMTKNICIIFFTILGLLLGPMQSFAHSNKIEMKCCQKESSDSEKSCCKKNQSKGTKHSCDGSCSGASCACPMVYCGVFLILDLEEQSNSRFAFSNSKSNFFYSEIIISSDFRSIWLPPKIG